MFHGRRRATKKLRVLTLIQVARRCSRVWQRMSPNIYRKKAFYKFVRVLPGTVWYSFMTLAT